MEFRYFLDDQRLEEYSTISESDFETLVMMVQSDPNYLSQFFQEIDIMTQDLRLGLNPSSKGFLNYLKRCAEIDSLSYKLFYILTWKKPEFNFWYYLFFELLSPSVTQKYLFHHFSESDPESQDCLLGLLPSQNLSIYLIIIALEKLDYQVKITNQIIKNKELKKLWLQDLKEFIDFSKKACISSNNFIELNLYEKEIIYNIINLFFHYWMGGLNRLNQKDLTIDYLNHHYINVYQYQPKGVDEDKSQDYPLMIHLFYLIYALVEVIYIGLIHLYFKNTHLITDARNLLDNGHRDGSSFFPEQINIERYIQKMEEIQKKILNSIRNNGSNLDYFLETLFNWSLAVQKEEPALFTQSIQTYLTFYAKSEELKLGAHLPPYSLSILIGLFNEETLPKPSQLEIYDLMQRNLINHNFSFLDDYYFRHGTLSAIINLYLNLEDDAYNKHNYRYQIHKFIKMCCIVSKSTYDNWLSVLNSGIDTNILRFLNLIFSDLSGFLEKALNQIQKIHIYEKDPEDPLLIQEKFDLKKSKKEVQVSLDYVDSAFQFLEEMNSAPLKYYLSPELNSQIAKTFDFYLNKLLNSKKNSFKVQNPDEINFNPLDLLKRISQIIHYILGYEIPDIFIHNLCLDPDNFDLQIYQRLQEILSQKGILLTSVGITLTNLIKKLDQHLQLYGQLDWPDQFCDPFFYTPIQKAVCVPSSGIIMDSNNLKRMILENNRDPYQQELTMEELEEFNQKEEIQKKIKEFEDQKNEWLRLNLS